MPRHANPPTPNEQMTAEIGALLATASLANPPGTVRSLACLCGNASFSAVEGARAIRQERALSARMVELANTVSAGLSHAADAEEAALRLGADRFVAIALVYRIAELIKRLPTPLFDHRAFWGDSLARGCLARAVAMNGHRHLAGRAFLAGALQDLGVPLLAERYGSAYAAILESCGADRTRLAVFESQSLKYNHLHVTRRLLERWGFPADLCDALARHHTQPPVQSASDAALQLWQVAYFVGGVPLAADDPMPHRTSRSHEPIPGAPWPLRRLGLCKMLETTFGFHGGWSLLASQASQELDDIAPLFEPFLPPDLSPQAIFATMESRLTTSTPTCAHEPLTLRNQTHQLVR